MQYILKTYPVSEEEYLILEKQFGKLVHFVSWSLIKGNSKQNHTHEQEDLSQEFRISMLQASSYYKRQIFIERSLTLLTEVQDENLKPILNELKDKWEKRKHHGANRQKFGIEQEDVLDDLIFKYIPEDKRPNKAEGLVIDYKFKTYLKSIVWNRQRNLGKKISKESEIRSGMASLSEFDFLGG